MKSLIIVLAALLAACTGGRQATVTVENDLAVSRENETVELSWKTLNTKIAELTAENVIVTNAKGEQIPSQVIYAGEAAPQALIFQASVDAEGSSVYTVTKGVRGEFKSRAYGRFVPERMDDYAWENNLAAFRLYGPALEKIMVSNGIDYWAKSTPNLVIDDWYKKDLGGEGSYHLDTGEGCDCYNVGQTLGMGASAPYAGGKLWYSRNFREAETLDNGPIRTTAKITYALFDVDGRQVSLVKIISLDANTHFNRIADIYSGGPDTLSIAAGIVIHAGAELFPGESYYALYEPASDSHSGNDGPLGGSVVMPGGKPERIGDIAACVGTARSGQPLMYYMGAGTSKQDISAEQWVLMTTREQMLLQHPLKVTLSGE